jgi:hypothetical protein
MDIDNEDMDVMDFVDIYFNTDVESSECHTHRHFHTHTNTFTRIIIFHQTGVTKVRKFIVTDTWQSSSKLKENCFQNRNFSQEYHAVYSNVNYRYFHTDDRRHTDSGYHWFAVQFKHFQTVTGVNIKTKSDESRDTMTNMQVWASEWKIDFGSDKCNNRQFSSVFKNSTHKWIQCQNSRIYRVKLTETLSVNCGFVKVIHMCDAHGCDTWQV